MNKSQGFDKIKKVIALYLLPAFIFCLSGACNKARLEVKQDFPFDINVMPVPKEIANGETVEIRIAIQPSGSYENTHYFIRYFQYDGKGILRCYNDDPYIANDLYPLATKQFRLYYTSSSTVSQSFDIWISDNFGNEKLLSFKLNSSG